MIPEFDDHGLLPCGVYSCKLEDVSNIFTKIENINIRKNLYNNLVRYVDMLKKVEIPCRMLLVDGSFVTTKANPSDIDIAVVMPVEYRPANITQDYINVMHEESVKRIFGFNMFPVFEESYGYDEMVDFFQGMKPPNSHLKKGILKVII